MSGYERCKMAAEDRSAYRGEVRRRLDLAYHTGRRYLLWISGKYRFAKKHLTDRQLPCIHAGHRLPLYCDGRDADPADRENKRVNLNLAIRELDGLLLRPGETMSFWKCLGRPTDGKGYREAQGPLVREVGGGLCQISDLLFWMTMHTPLTVDERYRHNVDLYPEEGDTQPFGSGATCIYPRRDLMVTNDTCHTFQLRVWVEGDELKGQWRCDYDPYIRYRVVERDHQIRMNSTGSYVRHNRLYRQGLNPDGEVLFEELAVENHSIMQYEPEPIGAPA